jgi:hypothetical protein
LPVGVRNWPKGEEDEGIAQSAALPHRIPGLQEESNDNAGLKVSVQIPEAIPVDNGKRIEYEKSQQCRKDK